MTIGRSGSKLEPTLERVDDSPSGLLLYAVMAGVNAYRSRSDAEKVRMGLRRKHEAGGTPGVAPLGFLNVIETVAGRTVRSVAVDPKRAPLIQTAFDAYASGEFTISGLTDLLEDLGLRTVPRGTRLERPVSRSYVHKMPYYVVAGGYADRDGEPALLTLMEV